MINILNSLLIFATISFLSSNLNFKEKSNYNGEKGSSNLFLNELQDSHLGLNLSVKLEQKVANDDLDTESDDQQVRTEVEQVLFDIENIEETSTWRKIGRFILNVIILIVGLRFSWFILVALIVSLRYIFGIRTACRLKFIVEPYFFRKRQDATYISKCTTNTGRYFFIMLGLPRDLIYNSIVTIAYLIKEAINGIYFLVMFARQTVTSEYARSTHAYMPSAFRNPFSPDNLDDQFQFLSRNISEPNYNIGSYRKCRFGPYNGCGNTCGNTCERNIPTFEEVPRREPVIEEIPELLTPIIEEIPRPAAASTNPADFRPPLKKAQNYRRKTVFARD